MKYLSAATLMADPGKRADLIGLPRESASAMPLFLSYVVAKDAAEENALWVN